MSPPKKKRAPAKSAPRKLRLPRTYHALDFVQAPFRLVFWLIEQRKTQLQDWLDNDHDDEQ